MNEKLLARLAAMESELATLRAAPKKQNNGNAVNDFDPAAFARQLMADPVGTFQRMGVSTDHVTRVLVANAMGDQAPPELKVLAAMGPQVSAQHALDSKVEALSRQLSTLVDSQTKGVARESFKALASDKSKYPHLAKAYAADPSLFDEDLAGGDAAEIAQKLEARLAKTAAAFGVKTETPPASEANAEAQTTQSTQSRPALETGSTPPPLPQTKPGVFTQEEDQRLKAEILRKYPQAQ